jgi:Gluconate 2-dehydrogenase subunit 3
VPSPFESPERLPKVRGDKGAADPYELPRQRRGVTPQMHGRYPDYDVLEQVEHWDEVTRRAVLDRVHHVPQITFFTAAEADTAAAFCDRVTAQDDEPRIPVLNYVDEKLAKGEGDGYQYFDLPDDTETWRLVVAGLDQEARALGRKGFAELGLDEQLDVVGRLAEGKLHGGVWSRLNVSRAWSVTSRYVLEAFYAHPWSWNEIGFGGPAYPRGYSRFGSPHLDAAEREAWEGKQEFDRDPVRREDA